MQSNEPNKENPPGRQLKSIEELFALASKIGHEALTVSGIPEGEPDEFPASDRRWQMSFRMSDEHIVLTIQVQSRVSRVLLHSGFTQPIVYVLRDLDLLLMDPSARELFKIRNDEEFEDSLYSRALGIVVAYLHHLPVVLYHSFSQAMSEAIVGDVKKVVEPLYRDEDENEQPVELNLLPKKQLSDLFRRFPHIDFELLKYLDFTDREFTDHRKNAKSSRKALLTPQEMETLADKYEELRLTYAKVKKEYKELGEAYRLIHRNADGWAAHWENHLEEHYPLLQFSGREAERTPGELASRHLARVFDYNPKVMERKISESRAIGRDRNLRARQIPTIRAKHPTSDFKK